MKTVFRLTYDHQIQPTDYGLFSSKKKAMEFLRNNIFGVVTVEIEIDTPEYVRINGKHFGGYFIVKSENIR